MYESHESEMTGSNTLAVSAGQMGLWAFLASVTMLFAGFTSAILVRRTGSDWAVLPLPDVLWLNTTVLLVSSVTIEAVRRASQWKNMKRWLVITVLLGGIFLIGQIVAWRQLAALGVFLPSNPHSSFFYILTGVHGLHLLGGMLGLVYLLICAALSKRRTLRVSTLNLFATYWHFVGGLWVYLFIVLFVL